MKRTNKKGFTIVELVIVIAVIAILAAVLIPNISRLVKKAQISSDLSLVRNLNMALETESATMDYPTAYSAFQAVKENGYDIAKIEAKASNNQILYDEVNKCFAYMNGSKLEYYPNSTKSDKTTPDHQLWAVYTDSTKAKDSKYSVYWNGATAFDGEIGVGFDAGDTTGNKITYKGSQSVIIRTNGGELIVNAPSGHVEHYGLAKTITVTAISDTTYVEHGTVATLTVKAGAKSVVIKSTAVVVELTHAKGANVSIENNGYVGTAKAESGNDGGTISGTVGGNTIKVSTFDQLQGLALASTIGADFSGKTIELQNDIDASGRTWTPFGWNAKKEGNKVTNAFTGTIDGNGHKITGLSSDGYVKVNTYKNASGSEATPYALIAYATKNVTVKNLTLDVNFVQTENIKLFAAGVLASYDFDGITNGGDSSYQVLISNVTVNGNMSGADQVAGIMGTNYVGNCDNAQYAAVSFTLENCTNNATLKSEGRVGGIVCKVSTNAEGYEYSAGTKRKAVSFEVVNCKNAAKSIETTSSDYGVGGIIGFLTNSDTRKENTLTKITDCTSEGTLTAPNGKDGKLIYSNCASCVTIGGKVYTCVATTAYDSVNDFGSTTNGTGN